MLDGLLRCCSLLWWRGLASVMPCPSPSTSPQGRYNFSHVTLTQSQTVVMCSPYLAHLPIPDYFEHKELRTACAAEVVNTERAHGTPTRQMKKPPWQEKGSPSLQFQLPMERNHGKATRMLLPAACARDISRPKSHSGPIRICQYGRGKTLLRHPQTVQIRALTLPRKVV